LGGREIEFRGYGEGELCAARTWVKGLDVRRIRGKVFEGLCSFNEKTTNYGQGT